MGARTRGGTTFDIALRADIRNLKASLGELPGIGEKEAKAMVDKMTRQYRKLERSNRAMLKKQEGQFKRTFRSIGEAGDRISSELGGIFGDIGGGFSTLAESAAGVAENMGPVAGAAAGVTAAFGALAIATGFVASAGHEFIMSSDDMLERLEELGAAEGLDPAVRESLDTYKASAGAAEVATTLLKVEVAAGLADAFGEVPFLIVGAADALDRFTARAQPALDLMSQIADAGILMADVLSLGGAKVIRESFQGMAESGRELADSQEMVGQALDLTTPKLERQRAAVEGMNRAYEAQNVGSQSYDLLLQIQDDVITQEERLLLVTSDRTQAINELAAAGLDQATTERLHAENMLRLNRELIALDEEKAAVQDAELKRIQKLFVEDEKRARVHQETVGLTREQNVLLGHGVGFFGDLTQAAVNHERARIDGMENMTRQERRNARKSWRFTKKLQIGMATVEAARAGISLIPSLSFLGPGAPVAAAAIASAGLGLAIQGINSAPKPEFSLGGMVGSRQSADHRAIAARDTEAVLTETGVARVGGEAGVEALNEGRGVGQSVSVVAQFERRHLGMLASEMARDPAAMRVLRHQSGSVFGRRSPFGRP